MIRKAKPSDVNSIVDLAVESVERNPLPVKTDRDAMKQTVLEGLNPAHFLWVSEIDGEVVGAIGAMVSRSFWFKGLACSVMIYYCRKPGDGGKLLREFARWVKSRSGIKTAVIEFEPETDGRLIMFMERLGFSRRSQNLTYVRSS